ncbi:MAG: PIG-L deacetylase family protein [Chloroflexus sp.]|uniref:PIG-L deacetylase family protein n=1 Tax=Chloroflexus sp. TaxID=1904827 RepID=UPI00404A3E1B
MVVTAHPDDESFPIGGTIARYATQGVDVTLLCAARGEKGIPNLSAAATAALREQELRKAAAELAVSDVRFLDLIDGEVMQADADYVVGQLVTTLQQIRPDVVITFGPDGISGHPDHIAISHDTTQAFKLALEKKALSPTARLYYITPSEATAQGCGVPPASNLAGGPVAAIDVSNFLVAKVRTAQQHVSQHPPF